MAMYSALRDAFNDLNKSVRDQADWEERHAVDRERRASDRMMIEQNLQDQLLRRESLKLSAMKATEQMRPKTAMAYNLIQNNPANQEHIFQNAQWRKDSGAIMGGTFDDATGSWFDSSGQPVKYNDYIMTKKMAAVEGLTSSTANAPVMWNQQHAALSDKITAIDKGYDKLTKAEKIKANREKFKLTQKRNQVASKLTDANLLDHYSKLYQNATGKAKFFTTLGDTATAAIMQKNADDAQTNTQEIIKQLKKERNGGRGLGTTSGHDVFAQKAGYYMVDGKEKYKEIGQWVRNIPHNFTQEGDITRKLRNGETLVRDLQPKGNGADKQTGALTFDQAENNIALAHTTTGTLGQNIINPAMKPQVHMEKQLMGLISSSTLYQKQHGRDHKQAQLEAQKIGKQINNAYFKSVDRANKTTNKDKLVALILESDPTFIPKFKKGKVSNSIIELRKIHKAALLVEMDKYLEQKTGQAGLGYVPFRKGSR